MEKILIIDDEEATSATLCKMIRADGYEVRSADTIELGVKELGSGSFDVVFLDVMLPDGNGLDILPKILNADSEPEVFILTAGGSLEGAEIAITKGAWGYLQKPISQDDLRCHIFRALQYRRQKPKKASWAMLKLGPIIGRGPEISHSLDLTAQAAGTDANVLIQGETGTGKELFARAIHENSARCGNNFVVVDCAALPENIVESTLFGHEKGAFTGADRPQEGLVVQADKGTLFLDEIGELPLSIQKKFLRVLQERQFRPVGAKKEVRSDFRLIAATNCKLGEMVKAGTFREDLLFRLRTLVIELAPLRGRKNDIRNLALHYSSKFCERYGMDDIKFSSDFMDVIWSYPWPGNVRELIHALEKAITTARNEPTLHSIHLPTELRVHLARASLSKHQDGTPGRAERPEGPDYPGTFKEAILRTERRYISDVMQRVGKNVNEACQVSGLSKTVFYEKLKRHQVEPG